MYVAKLLMLSETLIIFEGPVDAMNCSAALAREFAKILQSFEVREGIPLLGIDFVDFSQREGIRKRDSTEV